MEAISACAEANESTTLWFYASEGIFSALIGEKQFAALNVAVEIQYGRVFPPDVSGWASWTSSVREIQAVVRVDRMRENDVSFFICRFVIFRFAAGKMDVV
jgi:hypothetical protein